MEKIYSCVLFIIIGLLAILVLMMILYYPLIYKCQQDFSAISKNVVDISQNVNQIMSELENINTFLENLNEEIIDISNRSIDPYFTNQISLLTSESILLKTDINYNRSLIQNNSINYDILESKINSINENIVFEISTEETITPILFPKRDKITNELIF